jgi:hypothetical protein
LVRWGWRSGVGEFTEGEAAADIREAISEGIAGASARRAEEFDLSAKLNSSRVTKFWLGAFLGVGTANLTEKKRLILSFSAYLNNLTKPLTMRRNMK